MVIPSDQLSIAYFCKWFFIIAFASMLFSWFVFSLFLSDFFYVDKHLFSDSADGFDSPFNLEEYARFTFFLLTSWSNKGARIDSVRFIRELFSPTFFLSTVMVYKTAASGLAKPASYPNMAGIYVSYICYITDTHIRIINRLAV